MLRSASSGCGLDDLDEVVVVVGHRIASIFETCSSRQPNRVEAIDHDVSDLRVIDVLLDPTEGEEIIEDAAGQLTPVGFGQQCPPRHSSTGRQGSAVRWR